jgi:predicted transcriptional regulator
MSTVTVRVRPHTYRILQQLAREHDESLPDTLDRLVEEMRRIRMFQEAAEDYAAIAADPDANAAWQAEIAAWDVTVSDGLPSEPGPWDEA